MHSPRLLVAAALLSTLLASCAPQPTTGELFRKSVETYVLGCATELSSLCADSAPQVSRQMACLHAHQESLSPPCAQALQESTLLMDQVLAKVPEYKAACLNDLAAWCANVTPGDGRLIDCLLHHEADLTPDCQKVMAELK